MCVCVLHLSPAGVCRSCGGRHIHCLLIAETQIHTENIKKRNREINIQLTLSLYFLLCSKHLRTTQQRIPMQPVKVSIYNFEKTLSLDKRLFLFHIPPASPITLMLMMLVRMQYIYGFRQA